MHQHAHPQASARIGVLKSGHESAGGQVGDQEVCRAVSKLPRLPPYILIEVQPVLSEEAAKLLIATLKRRTERKTSKAEAKKREEAKGSR